MSSSTVLFDAPGPRARRLHLIVGVVGVLVLLGLLALVIRGLANPANNQLTAEKWAPFLQPVTWTAYLLPGLLATLKAAALGVVLSGLLGVVLGTGRLSQVAPIRVVAGVLVEFFRAVPVLMMMVFFYFFGLFVLQISGDTLSLFGVVAGLTVYNSAVIAELIATASIFHGKVLMPSAWAAGSSSRIACQ